ncbi:MAG: toxic anion resistance protein, partial [Lawsonibacter sp.]|nr:toxic anion resistance protein [Lawsonibacter sp.]
MSDELNLNTTPELTFDSAAAQAVEAPALTLEPTAPAAPQVDEAAQAARDANAVKLDESMLSEAEKKM